MKLTAAFLLAFAVTAYASSSSSSSSSSFSDCIPTESSATIASSLTSVFSSVSISYPSVYSIASALSVVEQLSPTVSLAESTIEYYILYYETLVWEIEYLYSYSSLYTYQSYLSELTAAYPSLAAAVSYIESVEMTQSALALYQSSLQYIESSYPSFLTEAFVLTGEEYPSIYYASQVISQATLTDSSIFASVLEVSTAVSGSPTLSYAVSYLSYAAYTLPSSVVSEILTYIYSPSTVGSSTVSSLESCYSTVYSAVAFITGFTYYYPSIDSALTAYISAASLVSSLGSAVYYIETSQMSTFTYEVSVLTAAASIISTISTDLEVLYDIGATSPSLLQAESTIEGSFYASPSIAYTIYYALDYPSLVSSPTAVAYYEESHESLVSAITSIFSWEAAYTSSASELSSIESQLTSAFASYRTLLTAYSYVQDITSPSIASASASIYIAKSDISSITYVLSQLTSVISAYPSLSCDEGVIEYYATAYPSVVSYILQVIDDSYYVPVSQASSFDSYDSYSFYTLYQVIYSIEYIAEQSSYSYLLSLESSFVSAAESDSSLLTQYETFSSASYSASYSWSTQQTFVVSTVSC